jgi:hypothetical protein
LFGSAPWSGAAFNDAWAQYVAGFIHAAFQQVSMFGRALMQKATSLFGIVVFLVASSSDLRAGSLAGVNMPDTVQVAGTTLLLNGWDCATSLA